MEPAKPTAGRPRSQQARDAILHAADDLLVEHGYAAMTMKGIADRAGVGRQTVYRWWSSKAEVLLEASAEDAEQELAVDTSVDPELALLAYLEALIQFLTRSAAGSAYRALLGEAQHDATVAQMLAGRDVLGTRARAVLRGLLGEGTDPANLDRCAAALIGPSFYWLITGGDSAVLDLRAQAAAISQQLAATRQE